MMMFIIPFCRLLLLCIYVTSFLGDAQPDENEDACEVLDGEPVTFYPCGTNCSQQDAFGFLNCSIGKKEEVEKYPFEDYPPLAPPDLIDIKYLYGVIPGGETVYSGSIYIQFRLPSAFKRTFPDAVRLFFQGLSKDDYYNTCPRHRIFIFHNYHPESMRESVHPRNISYNCFYGVDTDPVDDNSDYRIKYKKGYFLGLKSNPGQWINYTVTINCKDLQAISPVIPIENWIPAIAVSLDIYNYTLKVLVEKKPDNLSLQYAVAELRMVNNKAWISEELVDQKCTFHGLVHGHYTVKVVIRGMLNGKFQNWTAESVEIDATGIPKDEYPIHYADPTVKPLKIFSMVGGCLSGLALLVLFGGIVYRQRVCKKVLALNRPEKGFILHPYDNESDSITKKFTTRFGCLVKNKCACSLLSWNPEKSRSREQVRHWLENEFRSLTFILVFYDSSCYYDENVDENTYSCILKAAVKRKKMNLIRIIPICLTSSHSLPSVISQETVVNWDDLENLYHRIHPHIEVSIEKKISLSGKWKSTNTGKYLLELFRRMNLGNPSDPQSHENNDGTDVKLHVISDRQSVSNEDLANEPPGPQDLQDMQNLAKMLNKGSDEDLRKSLNKENKTETRVHSVKADIHFNSTKVDEPMIKSPHQITPPQTSYHQHTPKQYPRRSDQCHQHRVPGTEDMPHTDELQQRRMPFDRDMYLDDSFWSPLPPVFDDHTGLPNLQMNGEIPDDLDPIYPDETQPMIPRGNKSGADFCRNQRYRPTIYKHQNMPDLPQIPNLAMHLPPDQYGLPVQRDKTCRREDLGLSAYCQSRTDGPQQNAISHNNRQFAHPNGYNPHKYLSKLNGECLPLLHAGEKLDDGSELCHRTIFKAIDPPPFEKESGSRSRATEGHLQREPRIDGRHNGDHGIDDVPMIGHRMELNALDLVPFTGRSGMNQGHFQKEPDCCLDQRWDDVLVSVSQAELTAHDFECFRPVPPSNHDSEESIASGEQLDELWKINEDASNLNQ